MKILLRTLFIAALSLCSVSCSDDEGISAPDNGGDDAFEGPHTTFVLGPEAEGLTAADIDVFILAPDGSEIVRHGHHCRIGDKSTITMDGGLAEGTYRLLAASYARMSGPADLVTQFPREEFGLGSRIEVCPDGISVIDSFDPVLRYAGRGTKDDPYVVSSSSHLMQLMLNVNDYDSNRFITESTYFIQARDIDMKSASRSCDMEYGWLPIGADTNTPFRGVYLGDGHEITNLEIDRPRSPGIGLFGYLYNATVDGLHMRGCRVTGQFAVGVVAGAVITSSESRGKGTFSNCVIDDCTVSGDASSVALGAVLGATDMHATTLLSNCTVSGGSATGGYNVGGLTGGAGMFSSVMISACSNSAQVTSSYSGAGGMIGTADTLQIVGCSNAGRITGAVAAGDNPAIGAGGLAGGSGMSWISGSTNSGSVSGNEGVGGIIGSTRVKGSATDSYVYNPTVLRYCANTGDVSGRNFVGGAAGEAQFGSYATCNTGSVSGDDYVGGIVGNTSVAVVHNSVNGGQVRGSHYVSGIVGKTTWGSLALDHNLGAVNGSAGNTAGVVALAGNNTVIHYCGNFGSITGNSGHPVAGIAAEIGDPREWTAINIAECVVGSLECIMAVAGPVIAIAEHAIELTEGVEIALKLFEFTSEAILQSTDYVLLGYSIDEIVGPEMAEELKAGMHAACDAACTEVADMMRRLRQNCGGDVRNLDRACLAVNYMANTDALISYYEGEGNDEKFNEAINEAREERAEALEKVARAKEITHTVIAGVAVVTSTIALIGTTVATGGAAAPFIVAGSLAAVVGGTNAIVKSCTEFEKNAVIISQCINAGTVGGGSRDKTASIVGRLNDGSDVHDCLNTALINGGDSRFMAAGVGSHCELLHCISLTPDDFSSYDAARSVVCDPQLSSDVSAGQGITAVPPSRMGDASVYTSLGFGLGSSEPWIIPAGASVYPVPNISEMQR